METKAPLPENTIEDAPSAEELREQRRTMIGLIIGGVVLLALIVAGVVFLLSQPADTTGKIRDVFIIFMALESILIGLALIILIVQIAQLINLLQNEIKPIIDSTNETVSTLRGTTQFLSDNLVKPVIKLNEYLAGMQQLFRFVKPKKKS
jgi:NADH:ubiquinone oxidoreductase subunit K